MALKNQLGWAKRFELESLRRVLPWAGSQRCNEEELAGQLRANWSQRLLQLVGWLQEEDLNRLLRCEIMSQGESGVHQPRLVALCPWCHLQRVRELSEALRVGLLGDDSPIWLVEQHRSTVIRYTQDPAEVVRSLPPLDRPEQMHGGILATRVKTLPQGWNCLQSSLWWTHVPVPPGPWVVMHLSREREPSGSQAWENAVWRTVYEPLLRWGQYPIEHWTSPAISRVVAAVKARRRIFERVGVLRQQARGLCDDPDDA